MNRYFLGIDIGGTNAEFAYVSTDGTIIASGRVPVKDCPSPVLLMNQIRVAAAELAASQGFDSVPFGVGVGAPAARQDTGCIEGSTDLPWESPIPMAAIAAKEFGVPAVLTNDANAAALGEMMFGAAKGLNNFIMLTLGTGVGSAIVADGQLITGAHGQAGELGHFTLGADFTRPCSCGRAGCLQTYASASGVTRTALGLLEISDAESVLREIPADEITAKYIYDAATHGDELALHTWRLTGEVLGKAMANFASFSDPEAYIFFGGVAQALPFMQNAMKDEMEKNILFLYSDKIQILPSRLSGAEAALLGAAAAVMKTEGLMPK